MTKTVLITGANKGIGLETARQLGALGYRVWLGARDPERGETATKALCDLGYDVRFVQIAVNDDSSIRAAAEAVARADGKLDILINNAGIPGNYADPLSQGISDIRHVYETNVFGPINMIYAFIPLLKAAGKAHIVNLSSGLGSLSWMSDPQHPFYGANLLGYNSSKTAVNAITISFAKALAEFHIRVNSVNPGYVKTDFTNGQGYQTTDDAAKTIIAVATNEDAKFTARFVGSDGRLPW